MAELIHDIDAAKLAANLEEARAARRRGGRDPRRDQVRAAGGDGQAGRGGGAAGRREPPAGPRRQARALGRCLQWDFIGNLQSRKVKQVLPLCRLIHSVATDSVLDQLGKHGDARDRGPGRGQRLRRGGQGRGRARRSCRPSSSAARSRVGGLMTMPPFSPDPEHSRPYFARLAELAAANGLSRLSMGTSQDWRVAVEEGATIIRLGHALFV